MKKPRSTRRVTRREVAAAAGVSLTTVTHALNDTPGTRISPETRCRIRSVARRLGYQASFLGQALSQGATGLYGLVLPRPESVQYSLYTRILHALVTGMNADGKHIILLFRSEKRPYAELIRQGALEGMFIMQSDDLRDDIEAVAATGIRTVVVNKRIEPSSPALGMVQQDHTRLAHAIVERFARDGRRNILFFHDPSWCDANIVLQEGLDAALAAQAPSGMRGVTVIPDATRGGDHLRELLAATPPPDGVYCVNAVMAATAAQALRQAGREPGRDTAIIYSDVEHRVAEHPGPFLGAFRHDPARLGVAAWELMRTLPERDPAKRRILIPYDGHEGQNP